MSGQTHLADMLKDAQERIREGERLFKKMLVMSGAELGGPHPIWADVERWLGDPPGSTNSGGPEHG